MSAPSRAPTAGLLTAAVLALGATACGPLTSSSAAPDLPPCKLVLNAPPSADIVMVDLDSPAARAELKTMLFTARPNEHFIIVNADSGQRLGSYTTPAGLVIPGPTPPTPLPADPTQVQRYAFRKDLAHYKGELRQDLAKLQQRWLPALIGWAGRVFHQAAAPQDVRSSLVPELHGFTVGLKTAMAAITSLENVPGLHLDTRIVLAILGLDGVPTRPPPKLAIRLHSVTIAVTGFDVSSSTETAWRQDFLHAGAREAVILPSSTSDELPVVAEPVLAGRLPLPSSQECRAGPLRPLADAQSDL